MLAGVCAAIADLPTERIAAETCVLQAENCPGAHPTAAALWGARSGLARPGLAGAGGGVIGILSEDRGAGSAASGPSHPTTASARSVDDVVLGLPATDPRPEE